MCVLLNPAGYQPRSRHPVHAHAHTHTHTHTHTLTTRAPLTSLLSGGASLGQVSRNHARITYRAVSDTFVVEDCGSLNGVFVNLVKIAQGCQCPLALGSEIVFGGQLPKLPAGSRLRVLHPHVFSFRLVTVPRLDADEVPP